MSKKKSSSAERDVAPPAPAPLSGTVADAHCHLGAMAHRMGLVDRDQPPPDSFVRDAVQRAAAVGITRLVNVGCEVGEWEATLATLTHPEVFGALAVHPTEVGAVTDDDYARLEGLLAHDKVVAVGETGLDYYWDRTEPAQQQQHFRRHIELAKAVGKPLMIHDRQAHADVLRILAEQGAPPAGVVFHAFSGDAEMARRCVEAGYVLSFPGVLTFANAPQLREAAVATPLESMLVETDAPFLTPHPYRGRPNAPYLIPLVIRQVAELKGVDESVVCATISSTAARIFGI